MTDVQPEAAPEAVAPKRKKLPDGFVNVRITKMGHDKVFTGETLKTANSESEIYGVVDPFPRFAKDSIVQLPLSVAQSLEDRGFAEIQD